MNMLNRFSLSGDTFHWQVVAALIFLWMLVVLCTLHSISTQKTSETRKRFWMILVVVLPILGVLVYLPYAIDKERLASMAFFGKEKSSSSRSETEEETYTEEELEEMEEDETVVEATPIDRPPPTGETINVADESDKGEGEDSPSSSYEPKV